jgi:hypothetical protein
MKNGALMGLQDHEGPAAGGRAEPRVAAEVAWPGGPISHIGHAGLARRGLRGVSRPECGPTKGRIHAISAKPLDRGPQPLTPRQWG